jgi:cytochrome c2
MKRMMTILATGGLLTIGVLALALPAAAGGDHQGGHMGAGTMPQNLDEMRDMHKTHEHGHDFEAMEEMSPAQRDRMMALMHEIGVAMPPMDPERGRHVFVEKGCVACHSVNGVGGDLGPALNAADMPSPMNSFEFAARMWRGAQAMTALQEDLLGAVISLDGQDLADLVAFAHDAEEQGRLTEDQIPERFHGLIEGN